MILSDVLMAFFVPTAGLGNIFDAELFLVISDVFFVINFFFT